MSLLPSVRGVGGGGLYLTTKKKPVFIGRIGERVVSEGHQLHSDSAGRHSRGKQGRIRGYMGLDADFILPPEGEKMG